MAGTEIEPAAGRTTLALEGDLVSGGAPRPAPETRQVTTPSLLLFALVGKDRIGDAQAAGVRIDGALKSAYHTTYGITVAQGSPGHGWVVRSGHPLLTLDEYNRRLAEIAQSEPCEIVRGELVTG